MTKIELELISDPDMYLFLMDTIRGGISVCNKKHVLGDNKYIDKNTKNDKYIFFWTQTIFMVIQCLKNYHIKILIGQMI